MSLLSDSDAEIRCLVGVPDAREAAFVRPVHKIAPVGLVVFEEFTIEFEILTNLENYIIFLKTCVPLARSVSKGSYSDRDVNNGSLLSMEVFELYFS
jgi:hypothetical protein